MIKPSNYVPTIKSLSRRAHGLRMNNKSLYFMGSIPFLLVIKMLPHPESSKVSFPGLILLFHSILLCFLSSEKHFPSLFCPSSQFCYILRVLQLHFLVLILLYHSLSPCSQYCIAPKTCKHLCSFKLQLYQYQPKIEHSCLCQFVGMRLAHMGIKAKFTQFLKICANISMASSLLF